MSAVQQTVTLGPAGRVTLLRAAISVAVAVLVALSFWVHVDPLLVASSAGVALVLDNVDGRVARRTDTVTDFGARFDMEVDAFLILVLSAAVADQFGAWVLIIGLARYAQLAAERVAPWLRHAAPPRYWCKVVAATQGVVLALAVSRLLPAPVMVVAVATALALLLESFGREVAWKWRHRASGDDRVPVAVPRWMQVAGTVLAASLVWFVLVAPTRSAGLSVGAFLRIPLDGMLLLGGLLLVPARARRATATVAGVVVSLLTLVKLLDVGFQDVLERPFNPVTDWGNFGPALGVLRDSVGSLTGGLIEVGVVVAAVAVIVLVTGSVVRVTAASARHRPTVLRAGGVLTVAWVVFAALGVAVVPGAPLAAASDADLAWAQVSAARAAVADERTFGTQIAGFDPYAHTPAPDLLTALRGKDVVFAFVESYGQVALQDSWFAPADDEVVDAGSRSLHRAGWSARSAWLTSSTFGGLSWLAHSTLQSGTWVDSQARYDQLIASRRFTLSDAFGKAGWRTVSDVPSDPGDWPPGRTFYHYDKLYNAVNVGYRGPRFGYARITDQYTLAAFQRRELLPSHKPLMAEIDLVSSHTPWAPLPRAVPWPSVGDGSVFDGIPAQGKQVGTVWSSDHGVQAAYAQSIRYSVNALVAWVEQLHDPNLVLVMLGDHQPSANVSGADANHNVPVSIVASDPSVLGHISSWGWSDGLRPSRSAPLQRMDSFRNQFLDAFR